MTKKEQLAELARRLRADDLDGARRLLDEGLSVKRQGKLLAELIDQDKVEAATLLVERGAPCGGQGKQPGALTRAVKRGHRGLAAAILEHAEVPELEQLRALEAALGHWPIEVAREWVLWLLDHGVSPRMSEEAREKACKGGLRDVWPVHFAVRGRRTEALRAMLQHGADPNLVDYRGNPPLYAGGSAADIPVLDPLIEAGARIDITVRDGITILDSMCDKGQAGNLRVAEMRRRGFAFGTRPHERYLGRLVDMVAGLLERSPAVEVSDFKFFAPKEATHVARRYPKIDRGLLALWAETEAVRLEWRSQGDDAEWFGAIEIVSPAAFLSAQPLEDEKGRRFVAFDNFTNEGQYYIGVDGGAEGQVYLMQDGLVPLGLTFDEWFDKMLAARAAAWWGLGLNARTRHSGTVSGVRTALRTALGATDEEIEGLFSPVTEQAPFWVKW